LRKSDKRDIICLPKFQPKKPSGKLWSAARSRLKTGLFPICVGTSLFLVYPSIVSHQDVASLASSLTGERWLASITQEPGLSRFVAGVNAGQGSDAFAAEKTDPISTAAIPANPERVVVGVRHDRKPQTVNRTLKGPRVVTATFKAPPSSFTSGSVAERHSMLAPLNVGKNLELAFVKAKPASEALQVASAFHLKQPKKNLLAPEPDLPVMVASLVTESAPNILAYSNEPELERSPFAAVLEDETPISIIPKLNKGDHDWAANQLPKAAFSEREQHCLTAGIYFEARGEPVKGQAAVSQVILNRVKNPAYPDSICGVVYQNKEWRNRCQFSFACDRIKDKVTDPKRWEIASYVARETTEGRIWLKEVGSSTHYHATYVHPKWANTMKKVGRIGLHIFYRTFGGGWS
jgi:spore germination cell wall hydrolase CwlJ-like protein